jgi:hypothetical protein
MPSDATQIRFESDVHPLFGEFYLLLRFRTTTESLQVLLSRAGLPDPVESTTDPLPPWPSSCRPEPPPSGSTAYSMDPPGHESYQRIVAVNTDQSDRVLVIVRAMDNP